MGMHWTGIVFGLGAIISMGYWTTDFLVVQRVLAAKDLRSAKLAPIIGSFFKMAVPLIVILPGLLGLAVLPEHLVPESALHAGQHSYNEVLPLMLARYLGPGLLGLGITALVAGFMAGHGRQRQRLRHRLDLRHLPPLPAQDRARRALRFDGPLVHHHRSGDQHRRGVSRHGIRQHHGLRTGAVQLLHRAAVRHRDSRHAVEARHRRGRILRDCWPERSPPSACF